MTDETRRLREELAPFSPEEQRLLDGECTEEEMADWLVGVCPGHPDDGEFNGPIGQTFYCDGTCR